MELVVDGDRESAARLDVRVALGVDHLVALQVGDEEEAPLGLAGDRVVLILARGDDLDEVVAVRVGDVGGGDCVRHHGAAGRRRDLDDQRVAGRERGDRELAIGDRRRRDEHRRELGDRVERRESLIAQIVVRLHAVRGDRHRCERVAREEEAARVHRDRHAARGGGGEIDRLLADDRARAPADEDRGRAGDRHDGAISRSLRLLRVHAFDELPDRLVLLRTHRAERARVVVDRQLGDKPVAGVRILELGERDEAVEKRGGRRPEGHATAIEIRALGALLDHLAFDDDAWIL